MSHFLHPQDPPEFGNCLRCGGAVSQEEVRGDGCLECEAPGGAEDCDAVAICGCRIVPSKKLGNVLVQCSTHAPGEPMHLNSADDLPPVDCPLLIEVAPGEMKRAHRTAFIASTERTMTYQTTDGEQLSGRFRWTYP